MKQSTNYGFNIPEPNDALDVEVIGQAIEQIDKTLKEGEIYHYLDILNQSNIIAIVKADETVPINATKLLMIGSDTEVRTTLDNDTCVAISQSITNNDGGTMSILIGENVPGRCRGQSIWHIAIDGEIDDSNYAVFLMENVKEYVILTCTIQETLTLKIYNTGNYELYGTYKQTLYSNYHNDMWKVSEHGIYVPYFLSNLPTIAEPFPDKTPVIDYYYMPVIDGYTIEDDWQFRYWRQNNKQALVSIYSTSDLPDREVTFSVSIKGHYE